MEKFIINGGRRLYGRVNIAPAKNACLPIIAACIMLNGEITLLNAPKIFDVIVMAEIVKNLGGDYSFGGKGLKVSTTGVNKFEADCNICKRARASFFIAGSLLARFKRAILPLPGGCNIGDRPVDIHIDVLSQFGAKATITSDYVFLSGDNLKSGKVKLSFPSVGATVNAICLACALKGQSEILNCAKEPEIADLCKFLNKCGYKISGIGQSSLFIEGKELKGERKIFYTPIKDRIEAGTFAFAVSACGGELEFEYEPFKPIESFTRVLESMGVNCYYSNGVFNLVSNKELKPIRVVADVYPCFPTDLQSPLSALCSTINGKSVVADNVFKKRFSLLNDLKLFGASCTLNNNRAEIFGSNSLKAQSVEAKDLRGGAGLVIVSLNAKGRSEISNAEIIRRGYENLDEKLRMLGADIVHILKNS